MKLVSTRWLGITTDQPEARMVLQRAGVQVSELRSDATWEWVDVRAPDGRLYLLASTRANGEGGGS